MSVAAVRHSTSAQEADLVCWTRMQSEAGQGLEQIVARKEIERNAGDGVFFWGVGNAPALATTVYARLNVPVKAIFSIMKSRPKAVDVAPRSLLVWRRYLDLNGVERELPAHALITSRGETAGSDKKRHYALMCHSSRPLQIERGQSFDPSAFRNVGTNGGPVGASQVTALVQRVKASTASDYEANLTAQLFGSYWVKLTDPVVFDEEAMETVNTVDACSSSEWVRMVSYLRNGHRRVDVQTRQPSFL